METPSPAMRELAGRLLAASQSAAKTRGGDALLVNERLRIALTRFTGAEGCAVLLRRAVALASAEVPALRDATFDAEGRVEGIEQLPALPGSMASAAETAVTAHLLGLLETFIGQKLTLMIVREACPKSLPEE
jgi:hypothetical protein